MFILSNVCPVDRDAGAGWSRVCIFAALGSAYFRCSLYALRNTHWVVQTLCMLPRRHSRLRTWNPGVIRASPDNEL